MAKKKNEKDVLIVRDEKTGEISVVAGLQADGTPRRTPPKMENAQDFLQFDKNGDVLDNFFRNFFRQCKEPSRFGFYRIAADQAENLLGVMKELLKDPVANADLLAPHKVDTSAYEKQVAQEQKAQEEQKKKQNQTNKVKDLGLPKGTTIGGLIRNGEGILVTGDTLIQAGDHVVVFCLSMMIKKIEKYFN